MKGNAKVSSETSFQGNFWSMLHVFLPFSPVSLTESCSCWYDLKDSCTLHKSEDKIVLVGKTDDVTSGRRDLDPRGRLPAVQGRMG